MFYNGSQINTVNNMKEEILSIASDLREGYMNTNEAKEHLLRLFGVIGSVCDCATLQLKFNKTNRTKDELLLECIKQFEHIENVLGYDRLSTTQSLIDEINQALTIPAVVGQGEQLSCGRNITTCVFYKDSSNSIATEYAEFCVRCDREGLPLLCLEDYIKQYCR